MKRLRFLLLMLAAVPPVYSQSIYDCNLNPWVTPSEIYAPMFTRPCIKMGNGNTYSFGGTTNQMIRADEEIHITGNQEFHAGAFSPGGQLHLQIFPYRDLDVIVVNYPNFENILRYEKFELGVKLPVGVQTKVDNYINELPMLPANLLNPFRDDQLRVTAFFKHIPSGTTKSIEGFYYRDMQRNVVSKQWDYQPTPYPFRVRFAPPLNGQWECNILIIVNGVQVEESGTFTFNVVESGNPGFVSKHPNGKNLQLGGQVIYPIGQALPWPVGEWNAPQNLEPWLAYHDMVDQYLSTGNKYVRMLFHPESNDIEFEKLNNYYDRLDYAWEMDKVIEKLEDNDAYVQLCMMMHGNYMNVADYDITRWDFSNVNRNAPFTDQYQSCYKTELGLTDATQMFTNPQAQYHLKQRMRYLISRYGYSTCVSVMDMGSEMYHTGESRQYMLTPTDTDWVDNGVEIPCSPYAPYTRSSDDYARLAVYTYHQMMTDYIKNTLGHTEHLLGTVYGMVRHETNGCGQELMAHYPFYPWDAGKGYPDFTYTLPTLDVISINHYSPSPQKLVWNRSSDHDWFAPNEGSYAAYIHDLHVNFGKPVIFTEIGSLGYDECDGNTQYYLDNMTIPFTGAAAIYQWHQGFSINQPSGYNRWDELELASQFMNSSMVKNVISTDWKQYREVSHGTGNNDGLKEYQMYVSANGDRAVGFVRNRTVNSKTMALTSPCTEISSGDFSDPKQHVYWNDDNNKLHYLGIQSNSDYLVHWYDYITGIEISTQCITTPLFSFDYELIKHPDLFAWTEPGKPFRPVVWFMMEKVNCKSSLTEMPEGLSGDAKIYPNPSSGRFTVELLGDLSELTSLITIYDLTGRLVREWNVSENPVTLDLSDQPAGAYLVHIRTGESTIVKRVSIVR